MAAVPAALAPYVTSLVAYDTDLGKVKRIFKRIGEDLSKDAELAPGFIQPFKFQGVKASRSDSRRASPGGSAPR